MKVDINFSSLSEKEQIELAKEVIESTNLMVKRLIGKEDIHKIDEVEPKKTETLSMPVSLFLEMLELRSKKELQVFIQNSQDIPIEVLKVFAGFGSSKIKISVVANKNCTISLMKEIITFASIDVKCGIAKLPNVPTEILEELLKENINEVTCAVAQCQNPTILRMLAKSESGEILNLVAANEYTPEDILEEFIKKENDKILFGIIQNPKIGISKIKEIYLQTKNRKIQYAILRNRTYVREVVMEQLANEEMDQRYHEFYVKEARSHDTSPEILDLLAKKNPDYDYLLTEIAKNSITPKNILKKLGEDVGYCASCARENPNYPKEN